VSLVCQAIPSVKFVHDPMSRSRVPGCSAKSRDQADNRAKRTASSSGGIGPKAARSLSAL
jgi:hypothetical protein